MDVLLKFLVPFMFTGFMTLVALALIVVLRSDKAESDQRGKMSHLASILGFFVVACIPLLISHYAFNMVKQAIADENIYALVGIIGGAILGICLLGRSAFFSQKRGQENK